MEKSSWWHTGGSLDEISMHIPCTSGGLFNEHYRVYRIGYSPQIHFLCRKWADGEVIAKGRVAARADALRQWAAGLPSPWKGAMEATIFTGWIYDLLKPFAAELLVGHPLRMEAVTKAKKKSDRGSASTICDLLRANLLPVCTMLPPDLRELRQALRFRNCLVREAVRMHNHCAGLLMMNGVPYERGEAASQALLRKPAGGAAGADAGQRCGRWQGGGSG